MGKTGAIVACIGGIVASYIAYISVVNNNSFIALGAGLGAFLLFGAGAKAA